MRPPGQTALSGLLRCAIVLWIALCLGCACACGPVSSPPGPVPRDPLIGAALDTVIRFNESRQGSGEILEVHAECWAPEIADLEPRGVYWHNNNLAVVLSEAEAEADGLYLYVPISSYMPPDETFELQIGQQVYRLAVIR